MPIQITDAKMTCTLTSATAVYRPDADGGAWAVSWLPGRYTHAQAVTAMTLAETVAARKVPEDTLARHVDGWAAELGLRTHEALQMLTDAALDGTDG